LLTGKGEAEKLDQELHGGGRAEQKEKGTLGSRRNQKEEGWSCSWGGHGDTGKRKHEKKGR